MSIKIIKKLEKERNALIEQNAELTQENVDLTNKLLTKDIPIKEQHTRIKELEDNLALVIEQLEEKSTPTVPLYHGLVRDIQAPYVSYKIKKEESKNPKTTTEIKVSGAMEELKVHDIGIKLNELKVEIIEHFEDSDSESQ